jgi:uncharacterized integral membrane protein (TIGR00697 family)
MNNVLLIIIELIICYGSLVLLRRILNTEGIYIYAIIATIASILMTTKTIAIMNINIPLGFASITSLIIGGNILTQTKGKEAIRKYILIIITSFIISTIVYYLSSIMVNSQYAINSNIAYSNLFNGHIREYIALLVSLIIAIWMNSKIYYLLKRIRNKIIISNIFSIIITEFVENIIYVLLAYLYEFTVIEIALCIVFRYMLKTIIGIIGTYPIYIVTKFIDKEVDYEN